METSEHRNPLDVAKDITTGDRREAYGHPKENFADIATGWNVLMRREGGEISPRGVARMMIWTKLVRDANAVGYDNLVDIAGYANTMNMLDEVDKPEMMPVPDPEPEPRVTALPSRRPRTSSRRSTTRKRTKR